MRIRVFFVRDVLGETTALSVWGGEFRLKGWFRRKVASGAVYVGIELGGSPKCLQGPGRIYTIAFKAKCNRPVEGTTNLRVNATVNGGMISIYYNKQPVMTSEYSESVMIVSVNAYNSPTTPMFMIVPENSQTIGYDDVYIDVTFKDLRVFEGAYVNPSLGRSLDTNASPLFVTHNRGDEVARDMSSGFPVQPIRLFTSPETDAEVHGKTKIKVLLSTNAITWAGSRHIFVAYLYEVMGSQYVSNFFKRHLIKFLARNYSNTAAIRHKSITIQSDFTMQYPSESSREITWSLDESYCSSGKYSYCYLTGTVSAGNFLPNETYYFIQPLIVDDGGRYTGAYPHFVGDYTPKFL